MATADIRIGTSGYSFPDWRGPFYPEGLSGRDFLKYYSRVFDTVEINVTYYRIPGPDVFSEMVSNTDRDFTFVVKLHGSMTHERKGDLEPFDQLFAAVAPLEKSGRLAGWLAQLPWGFRRTEDNISYLSWLAEKFRGRNLFVEFRNDSWISPEVFGLLGEKGAGYCIVDEPQLAGLVPPVEEITGRTAYVRLHGRNAEDWWRPRPGSDRYLYDYSGRELGEWAEKIYNIAGRCDRVFVYFNNCHFGHAPRNARKLKQLLGLSEARESIEGELGF